MIRWAISSARDRFNEVPMTFEEIEQVLGFPLPEKSKKYSSVVEQQCGQQRTDEGLDFCGFPDGTSRYGGGQTVFRRVEPVGIERTTEKEHLVRAR